VHQRESSFWFNATNIWSAETKKSVGVKLNQAKAQTEQKELHNSIRSNTPFLKCRAKALLFLVLILIGIGSIKGPIKTTKALPLSPPSNQVPDAAAQVKALKPISLTMIDQAIAVLESGLQGMDNQERERLFQIFDPAETGDIDEAYVRVVLKNYRLIRETLRKDFTVREVDHGLCMGKRIYLTNLAELMVCPYFQEEENEYRKARTLIHETAHMALVVTDRPYFRPTSRQYKTLTPRGSWVTQIPFVGPIMREILKRDTLYHPDAYAHFALAVSGLPGSEKYHDQASLASAPKTAATVESQTGVEQQLLQAALRNSTSIPLTDVQGDRVYLAHHSSHNGRTEVTAVVVQWEATYKDGPVFRLASLNREVDGNGSSLPACSWMCF
jgi:hypothetical protein